jgi:hypothetical protein
VKRPTDNSPIQVTIALPSERKAPTKQGVQENGHCPNVSAKPSILLTGDDLWRHVRRGAAEHLELLTRRNNRGEAKVDDFHHAALVVVGGPAVFQQQVLQLYVPMHNLTFMKIPDTLAHLVEYALRKMIFKLPPRPLLQEAMQGTPIHEVHDYVDVFSRVDHVVESYDVRMPQALHQANLATDAFSPLRVKELVLVVDLDRDLATGLLVQAENDDRVGALPDLFPDGVIIESVTRQSAC